MAQAGYTPISLYYSTTAAAVPVNTNLASGELAINITDGKLYYKDNGGTVRLLASNATSAPVLTFSAGTTGFTPNTATSGAITLAGTLATANGGTNLTSFTSGGVVYASSTSALATGSALTFNGTNELVLNSTGGDANMYFGGSSGTTRMYLARSGSDSLLWNVSAGPMRFGTNDTERMRISSAGDVGLGVTPSTWSVGKSFEIASVGNSVFGVGAADMRITAGAYYNAAWKYAVTGSAITKYEQTTGVHTWWNAPSGTAGNNATFTQAMTLDASGNLGLGVTSPASRLHVYGSGETTLTLGNSVTGDYCFLNALGKPAAADGYTIFDVQAYSSLVSSAVKVGSYGFSKEGSGTDNKAYYALSTHNGTSLGERLRITSAGDVGIGTSSPANKLDVRGSTNVNGGLTISPNTNLKNTFNFTTNASNDGSLFIKSDTTDKVNIQANGSSYFEGGTVRFISTISVGNSTPSSSGAGLTFPVTQSASSNANTLDDYEEGTWTPVVSDASSGGNLATLDSESTNATYTKIGNMVYWRFSVVLTSKASMTAGETVFIQGFPFTSVAIGGNWYNPNATIIRNITFTGYVQFHQASSNTFGYFRENVSGAAGDNIIVSDCTDSAAMQASGFYRVSGA